MTTQRRSVTSRCADLDVAICRGQRDEIFHLLVHYLVPSLWWHVCLSLPVCRPWRSCIGNYCAPWLCCSCLAEITDFLWGGCKRCYTCLARSAKLPAESIQSFACVNLFLLKRLLGDQSSQNPLDWFLPNDRYLFADDRSGPLFYRFLKVRCHGNPFYCKIWVPTFIRNSDVPKRIAISRFKNI